GNGIERSSPLSIVFENHYTSPRRSRPVAHGNMSEVRPEEAHGDLSSKESYSCVQMAPAPTSSTTSSLKPSSRIASGGRRTRLRGTVATVKALRLSAWEGRFSTAVPTSTNGCTARGRGCRSDDDATCERTASCRPPHRPAAHGARDRDPGTRIGWRSLC